MKTCFLFMILSILTSCSMQKTKGVSLEQALSMSGENQAELEKVLEYYKNDSIKLEAARYLIRNMPFHFSRMEYFVSPEGERYVPDIRNFTDNQAVKRHCDSLQEKGYTIRKEIVYDIKALHSDYLIRNIDLAFQAWQKPWAKDISFEGFCRYILPSRAEVEPASDMRQELMEYYLPLIDSGKARNAFEACMIINKQFINDLKYKETGRSLLPVPDSIVRHVPQPRHEHDQPSDSLFQSDLQVFVERIFGTSRHPFLPVCCVPCCEIPALRLRVCRRESA